MITTGFSGQERTSEKREIMRKKANASSGRQNKQKKGAKIIQEKVEAQPQRELIIRVKRKRCEDPAEIICVLENSQTPQEEAINEKDLNDGKSNEKAKVSSFASLSLEGSRKKRLLLSRVTTFEVNEKHNISHDTIMKLKTKLKREVDAATECVEQEITQISSSTDNNNDTIRSSTIMMGSQVKRMKTMRLVADATTEETVSEGDASNTGYLIVHATQLASSTTSGPGLVSASLPAAPSFGGDTSQSQNPPVLSPKVKVLDPATRNLDRAITVAMKTGNFNEIATALIMGAYPNHQQQQQQQQQQQVRPLPTTTAAPTVGTAGGLTALMAATRHCNLRMVRRLLQLGVDPTLTDSEGNNALTYLRETRRNQEDAAEVRSLIQKAVLKQQQQQQRSGDVGSSSSSGTSRGDGGIMEEDQYVIDLYCVTDTVMGEVEGEDDAKPVEGGLESDGNMDVGGVPLRVNGLRILDGRLGHVRISPEEGAYDSDWSDLGDDEDPDSNDERFPGNDYPDEEDNEEEEENGVDEGDEDQSEDMGGGAGDKEDGGDGDDDVDSDDERLPRFERNWAVGRVIRPTYMGEDLTAETTQQTSASLRRLWEEDEEADAEDPETYDRFENGDEVLLPKRNQLLASRKKKNNTEATGSGRRAPQNEHTNRIAEMQDRTGMRFASNPREFDIRGLPKYGVELSDDELDGRYLEDDQDVFNTFSSSSSNGYSNSGGGEGLSAGSYRNKNDFNYGQSRPTLPRDTVAYDPELDNSSNDEMN